LTDRAGIAAAVEVIAAARAAGRRVLSEPEAKAFLAAIGIAAPRGEVVRSAADAAAAAARIGLPVAVKLVAAGIAHKSDVGGVVCPVATGPGAAEACAAIAESLRRHRPGASPGGFLIEAYRPADPEWILALRADPTFGPVLMFGLGGVHVETLRQVSFRLAPVSETEIDGLIADKPAMRLLEGGRGRPPADRAALKDAIRRLAAIAAEPALRDAIAEVEINPLRVARDGVLALDALVLLSERK